MYDTGRPGGYPDVLFLQKKKYVCGWVVWVACGCGCGCSRSPLIRYSKIPIYICCKDKCKYTNQIAMLLDMCNRCSFSFAGQIPREGGRMSTLGSVQS